MSWYILLLITTFGIFGMLFLMGSNRLRAVLVLASIFTYGLGIDVGITLEPPKIVALLGCFSLMTVLSIERHVVDRFFLRLVPFFCWTLVVFAIGYVQLPSIEVAAGWARGSAGKPLIQLGAFLIVFSFVPLVSLGLDTAKDVRWFLRQWTRIAVVSAFLCYFQVGWALFTGNALWGVFRSEVYIHPAFLKIWGIQIQRANALGGEPKQQGMAMFMSIVMLLATWRRGLLPYSPPRHLAYMLFVGGALFLTFSSGAYLVVLLMLVYLLLRPTGSKHHGLLLAFMVGGLCIYYANRAAVAEVYDVRVKRIGELSGDIIVGQYGGWKEKPAAGYLIENPHLILTGTGIGTAPFHYHGLVSSRYQEYYSEMNSGVLRMTYAFGVIGIFLFARGVWPLVRGREAKLEFRPALAILFVGVLLSLVPLSYLLWLMVVLGVAVSRGARRNQAMAPSYGGPTARCETPQWPNPSFLAGSNRGHRAQE